MKVDPLHEFVNNSFIFESVSIDTIATFAFGQGLSPDGMQVQHNNKDWFIEWARHKLAWVHDVKPSEIEFRGSGNGISVYPAGSKDGYYFVVEGRFEYRKETR